MNIRRVLIITASVLSVILLSLIATRYVLHRLRHSAPAGLSNLSYQFLPNFDDVRGVAERGFEKWIAANVAVRIKDNQVTFYSQKDGVAAKNTSGVINYQDKIWFASDGGVYKYLDGENRFKAYLHGENSITLFVDPYENKLYASTSNNFFLYDANTDQWNRVTDANAPVNCEQMEFTKDFIVASSRDYKQPPVTYNRISGEWSASSLPELKERVPGTLFKSADRIFIVYDYSKEYPDCTDQNRAATSIFFEFKNGVWQPDNFLNSTFRDNAVNIIKTLSTPDSITFDTRYDCRDNSGTTFWVKTAVDFSQEEVKITSRSEMETRSSNLANNAEYQVILEEISRLSGLKPYHKVLSYENNTIIAQAGNPDGSYSLTQIDTDGQKFVEKELIGSQDIGGNIDFNLVSCPDSNTRYLITGDISDVDGSDSDNKLFEIQDNSSRKIKADASSIPVLDEISLSCFNHNLYWQDQIESGNIIQAAIQGDQINISTFYSPSTDSRYYRTQNHKLWFASGDIQDELFSFDLATRQVDTIGVPFSLSPYNEVLLLEAGHDFFWFENTSGSSKELIKLDGSGKLIKTFSFNKDVRIYDIQDLGNGLALVSSSQDLAILSDSAGQLGSIDYSLLPFAGTPVASMQHLPGFKMVRSENNILFKALYGWDNAGPFIIPVAELIY